MQISLEDDGVGTYVEDEWVYLNLWKLTPKSMANKVLQAGSSANRNAIWFYVHSLRSFRYLKKLSKKISKCSFSSISIENLGQIIFKISSSLRYLSKVYSQFWNEIYLECLTITQKDMKIILLNFIHWKEIWFRSCLFEKNSDKILI